MKEHKLWPKDPFNVEEMWKLNLQLLDLAGKPMPAREYRYRKIHFYGGFGMALEFVQEQVVGTGGRRRNRQDVQHGEAGDRFHQ